MRRRQNRSGYRAVVEAALLGAVLVGVYGLYSAGFTAGLQFDDRANLSGLAAVVDFPSLLIFIFSGEAGPIGRPLALLTFAIQAPSWPGAAEDLLRANALIHLLNGALVALLAHRVGRFFPGRVARPGLLAVAVAGLWLAQPVLVSTSLLAVQRMTSLSATAVLAGLVLYVYGRAAASVQPRNGFLLMTAGVVGGTAAAVLVKETGALLPLYAWVLEATLIRAAGLAEPRAMRYWRWVFLGAPFLLLVGYVVGAWPGIVDGYAYRPFSVGERVATEAVILWDYLRQILVPDLGRLGPYQDGYPILSLELPGPWLALGGWLVASTAAILLRQRLPLVSLAVGWFLVGHVLESTVFPLELYFEHRNYLPSLGIVVLLVGGALVAPLALRRFFAPALLAYGVLVGWSLFQVTSLWGNPRLAAEVWAHHQPDSPRAAQHLSRLLLEQGETDRGLEVIRTAAKRMPLASDLALQVLQTHCGYILDTDFQVKLADTLERLPTLRYSHATVDTLQALGDLAVNGECPELTVDAVQRASHALLDNPAFTAQPYARSAIHHELARLARQRQDLDGTLTHLEFAFSALPTPKTAEMMASVLAEAGFLSESLDKLDQAERLVSTNPILKAHWQPRLEKARAVIGELPKG